MNTQRIPMGHYKIDRRFNDTVFTGQRKNKKRVRKLTHNDYKNRRIGTLLFIGAMVSVFGIIGHAPTFQPKETAQAQVTEEIPLQREVLSREQGFESREIPANYVEPDLYDRYFGSLADQARKVAKCESGDRDIPSKPNKNGTRDYGRMQVNTLWLKVFNLTPDQLLDAETNIKTAKAIYDRSGNWGAWYSSRKCHGLK